MDDYRIVILVGQRHVEQANICLYFMDKLYPDTKKIVLTSSPVYDLLDRYDDIGFIDENDVLNREQTKKKYEGMFGEDRRFYWYYQQFLKLNLHKQSIDENYVVWDGDTVPLKRIQFMQDGKFLFNQKTEHHIPYFDCMKRLLDLERQVDFSFISEYMIMNKSIVNEMIQKIEQRNECYWIEAVLKCINELDRFHSGFSEYETYGNYIFKNHQDLCGILRLNTIRKGKNVFGGKVPPKRELDEFAQKNQYDTICFENW